MSYNYISHDYGFDPTSNFQHQIYNQPRTARHNLSSLNGNISFTRVKPPPNSYRERNNIDANANISSSENVYSFENKLRGLKNRDNYHHGSFASFSQNNHHSGNFPSFNLPNPHHNKQYGSPPSLPFLNFDNIKQRKFQHSRSQNHYTPQNLYATPLETHLDKQNKVLTQIQGMLARQNLFDQQKHKVEMAQRIKELQLDRLVVHQELERQKSTRLQALNEVSKPEKPEVQKKENSRMKDIILDMILSKAKKRNKTPILPDSEESTPATVTLKHFNSERNAYQSNDSIPIRSTQSQSFAKARILRISSNNTVFNTPAADNSDLLHRKFIPSLQELKQDEDTSIQLDIGSKTSIQSFDNEEGEEAFKSVKRSKVKKQKTKRYHKAKSLKSFKSAILEEDDYEIVSANKQQKRKKARYRLMSLSWMLLYGKLLYQEKKRTTISKREVFDSKISSIIAQIHQMFYQHITQSAGKEILAMLKDTNHSYIFTDPFMKQKKSEQKSAALLTHLGSIFNKLIIQVSVMPPKVFELLKLFLTEDAFLPNDYFTAFELNRMKFGAFGTVREMHSGRIKLLIGSLFLARILLHAIIMPPWDAFNQPKSKFKIEKILNIGSILYQTLMIVLKSAVPSYQNNQSFLSLDLKVRPKKKLLQAIDDDPHAEKVFHIEKDQSKDGNIIEGFYAKQQLRTFFEDTKPRFEELKSLISGCLDALYERISTN